MHECMSLHERCVHANSRKAVSSLRNYYRANIDNLSLWLTWRIVYKHQGYLSAVSQQSAVAFLGTVILTIFCEHQQNMCSYSTTVRGIATFFPQPKCVEWLHKFICMCALSSQNNGLSYLDIQKCPKPTAHTGIDQHDICWRECGMRKRQERHCHSVSWVYVHIHKKAVLKSSWSLAWKTLRNRHAISKQPCLLRGMSSISHLPKHLSGSHGISWLVECLLVGIEQVTSNSSTILRTYKQFCQIWPRTKSETYRMVTRRLRILCWTYVGAEWTRESKLAFATWLPEVNCSMLTVCCCMYVAHAWLEKLPAMPEVPCCRTFQVLLLQAECRSMLAGSWKSPQQQSQ